MTVVSLLGPLQDIQFVIATPILIWLSVWEFYLSEKSTFSHA